MGCGQVKADLPAAQRALISISTTVLHAHVSCSTLTHHYHPG